MKSPVKMPFSVRIILALTIRNRNQESIIGDLEEFYREIRAESGKNEALIWCWGQCLRSIPRFLHTTLFWSAAMLINYLKIAVRNLRRNKLNSVINIVGLSMGIALCLLIALFIQDELNYDCFHEHFRSLYYLRATKVFGNATAIGEAQAPLGPTLSETFPEIRDAVRLFKQTRVIKVKERILEEAGIGSDPGFFRIFTFPFIDGSPDTVLSSPDAVVITAGLAHKLFGDTQPFGQSLSMKIDEVYKDFTVSGIIEDVPRNSSLRFQFIIPLQATWDRAMSDWDSGRSLPTFIRLSDPGLVESLSSKFPDTIDKRLGDEWDEGTGYSLHALADFHLRGGVTSILEGKSSIAYSYILSGIGILVLLIACFNYTNLSIGSASIRLCEIGIRKVLGAERMTLARQFFLESILISMTALILGFVLTTLFISIFNNLSQKAMSLDGLKDGRLIFFMIMLPAGVSLLAGGYPSMVLSGYTSVDLFRGKMKLSGKRLPWRILIILQFGISIFLITMTLFLYRQHLFLIRNPLGYRVEHLMVVPLDHVPHREVGNQDFFRRFKQQLKQHAAVESVSGSRYNMTSFWGAMAPKPIGAERRFLLDMNDVDHDFIATLGITMIRGSDFSKEMGNRADAVIVNEAFVRKIGGDDPVGKHLPEVLADSFDGEIIGVMKDFHYQSLHHPTRPALFRLLSRGNYNHCYIRIHPERLGEGVEIVRKAFEDLAPDIPFAYTFQDDRVAALYNLESRWNRMVQYASAFAFLIASSGLFAITILVASRRTKEVGIRKTLGASIPSILVLFQKEFIWLVLAANVIAWPAAYFLMKRILQNYAYRIQLDFYIFALAGLAALMLAVGIVSVHAVHTATINPVNTLRYE